jgi:hypothetical protein
MGGFFRCCVIGVALLGAHAPSHAQTIRLLSPDDGGAPPAREFSIESGMKIKYRGYWQKGAVNVGFSRVDGAQYAITTPPVAEFLYVQTGSGTYVDHQSGLHPLKQGDIAFIAPHRALTSRDTRNYSHIFITFPGGDEEKSKDLPNFKLLPPGLDTTDFVPAGEGREHVYFSFAGGGRIVAYEPDTKRKTGKLPDADKLKLLIIASGEGVLGQGSEQVKYKAGDTLLVQPGDVSWSGHPGRFIYAATPQ